MLLLLLLLAFVQLQSRRQVLKTCQPRVLPPIEEDEQNDDEGEQTADGEDIQDTASQQSHSHDTADDEEHKQTVVSGASSASAHTRSLRVRTTGHDYVLLLFVRRPSPLRESVRVQKTPSSEPLLQPSCSPRLYMKAGG